MRTLPLLAGTVLCLAVTGLVNAQTEIGQWSGQSGESFFGTAVAPAADADGDGLLDVLIGDPSGAVFGGRVSLISSSSGEVLLELVGSVPGADFGAAVLGLDDTNGDGVSDLAVGVPRASAAGSGAGQVQIFSGADGQLLRVIDGPGPDSHFGEALSWIPDLDGDGVGELVVGVPREGAERSGSVRVISGASGELILRFPGLKKDDFFGTAVCAAGDLNGDGAPDVMAGAPQSGNEPGYVLVFSGVDAEVLGSFSGDAPGDAFGRAVACTGDVNGDLIPDYAVGVPGLDIGYTDAGGVLGLSGATGSVLYLRGGDSSWAGFGYSVAGLGDVDGDGIPDVAMGTDRITGGEAHVWRGSDGAPISVVSAFDPEDDGLGSGVRVAAGGDLDGDQIPDLLLGVPTRLVSSDPGSVKAVRLAFSPWDDLGSSLGGSAGMPELKGVGSLEAGTAFELQLVNGLPFASATLVLGFRTLDAPFKGGVLVPDADVLTSGLIMDSKGSMTFVDYLPQNAEPGTSVICQVWFVDPGGPQGMAATNALQAVVSD